MTEYEEFKALVAQTILSDYKDWERDLEEGDEFYTLEEWVDNETAATQDYIMLEGGYSDSGALRHLANLIDYKEMKGQ
jgi:hypothetical protein